MQKHSSIREKFNKVLSLFHFNIFKTTRIGKKLLTASRTNAHLKETYEELGRIVEQELASGEVTVNSPRVKTLLHTISACKKDLEHLEKQVNKIRFSHKEGLV